MNRRSFLETLSKAAAGFTILPAATTYGRVWRCQRKAVVIRGRAWTKLGVAICFTAGHPREIDSALDSCQCIVFDDSKSWEAFAPVSQNKSIILEWQRGATA